MTPTISRHPGGRPRRQGTVVVTVRMPIAVYDAYCRRALKADREVRSVLRQTLTANVRRDDLSARQARAVALALLASAEDIDREVERRAARS